MADELQERILADLGAALAAEPRAQAMFDILTSQNRYAILYQSVTMLARGETVYPQKRTLSDGSSEQ